MFHCVCCPCFAAPCEQDCAVLRDFVDRLIPLFKRSPASAKWFLQETATHPSFVLSPLLTATDRRVRCNVARLLVEVVHLVLPTEATVLHDMELVPGSEHATQPRARCTRLVQALFGMIPGAEKRGLQDRGAGGGDRGLLHLTHASIVSHHLLEALGHRAAPSPASAHARPHGLAHGVFLCGGALLCMAAGRGADELVQVPAVLVGV